MVSLSWCERERPGTTAYLPLDGDNGLYMVGMAYSLSPSDPVAAFVTRVGAWAMLQRGR